MSSASSTLSSASKTESTPRALWPFTRIIVAFVVVAAGFVLATIYSEIRASAIDHDAEQIEVNALPSVEHIAAARVALWRLELAAHRTMEESGGGGAEAASAVANHRREVDRELALAFATDRYPGEEELESGVTRGLGDVDRLLLRLTEGSGNDARAREVVQRQLQTAIELTDGVMDRLQSVNATGGHIGATRIANIRAESVQLILGLNLACVAFAAVAAYVAVRSLRRQRNLELAHDALLQVQVAELERFASRVAHDLLSPLSALAFTLSSVERNADKGLPLAEPIQRAWACLRRSQSLVDGVMDFARSGGFPTVGHANLRRALDGVLEEARNDPAPVEIQVDGVDDDLFLACSAGVLSSILSNLVRNALKYMEDRPDRRLMIRASTFDGAVHVEIEDTGPGLPSGLEQHVFEPYVRSPDNPKPGLGLGLATVQRFVEAHRGRVGVHSAAGHGCLFWFDLPRATGSGQGAATASVLHE